MAKSAIETPEEQVEQNVKMRNKKTGEIVDIKPSTLQKYEEAQYPHNLVPVK